MPMQFNLAKFDPLTYEELAKPVAQAAEMHNQYEDALGTLATQASVWEKLANSAQDQREYQIYKAYANRIQDTAMSLMANGLQSTTRSDLNQLKSAYASQIQPISDAWTLREKAREQEAKEDSEFGRGTILREKSAFNRSLSDYANGLPATNAVNLSKLEDRVYKEALALSKQLRGEAKKGRLDAYTKTLTQQYGFTEGEIKAFMENPADPKASSILKLMYDNALTQSGVLGWQCDDNTKMSAINSVHKAIGRGLTGAIGEAKMTTYADKAAEFAHQERMAAAKAKDAAVTGINAPRLNNRYSNKRRTAIERGLKDYAKYIQVDPTTGQVTLTEEGERALNTQPTASYSANSITGASTVSRQSIDPFRSWYINNILNDSSKMYSTQNLNAGNQAARLIGDALNHNLNYQADGVRNSFLEFNVEDNADREKIKNNLIRSTSGGFQEYDYSDDGKSLVPTGGKMSRKDLNDADTKILGTQESALGTLVVVEDKNSKLHYIKADIDTDYSRQNIQRVYRNIEALEQMRQNSIRLENTLRERGTPQTENIAILQKEMYDPTTGTGSYIDSNLYEALVAQQWNLVQDYRAWSMRGITANPLTYGYSSTNTQYPGER